MDPLASSYPSSSHYNFVLNNPLSYIDPNGMEVVPSREKGIDYEETEAIVAVAERYSPSWWDPFTYASLILFGNRNYNEVLFNKESAKLAIEAFTFILIPGGSTGIGVGSNLTRRTIVHVGNNIAKKKITAAMLRFSRTTSKHMLEEGRRVPMEILAEAINTGSRMADPQGARGAVKIVSEIYKNGKKYSLEIIFRESDNTILHFVYK